MIKESCWKTIFTPCLDVHVEHISTNIWTNESPVFICNAVMNRWPPVSGVISPIYNVQRSSQQVSYVHIYTRSSQGQIDSFVEILQGKVYLGKDLKENCQEDISNNSLWNVL